MRSRKVEGSKGKDGKTEREGELKRMNENEQEREMRRRERERANRGAEIGARWTELKREGGAT